jgi:tetratricopeptide (TPR) repeat protein
VLVVLALALLLAADAGGWSALFRERKFEAAEQLLRKALARDPNDAPARLHLARTLIELKRTPEALGELERALAGKVTPEIRFEAGQILRELAERRFADLQNVAPNSAATLELAGARWELSGNLDEALREYRAAAALDPKRPGVHYRIGNVLWRKRETEAAAESLRRELGLTPHHGMANLRMGQILLVSDRSEEAIAYLERALSAMPASMEARREIGKAYRKAGHLAEARQAWEAVAKARPEDEQVHYLLGNLYREMGELDLAKRELEIHRAILARRGERPDSR